MSCSYADGLSPYENKGKLGLKEIFDSKEAVKDKVAILAGWIQEAKHVVIHTGAGISTTAGIPDFRGPKGVWTLEARGEKPQIDIKFDDAVPTKTHMAITKLVQTGLVKYVVSQNIDGLHLKSGLPRDCLSELHGNMYIEQCHMCSKQFVMEKATQSVGQKCLDRRCPSQARSRPCRGKTYDTILDWEAGLPEQDLDMAYYHSYLSDLNICLGTTLQINPSGNLPLNGKKKQDSRLVICNLQPTKHDKKADLIINTYVDEMMELLMGYMDLKIEAYSPDINPTKASLALDWTISKPLLSQMKKRYEQLLKNSRKRPSANSVYDTKKSKLEKPDFENNIKNEIKLEDCKEAISNTPIKKEKNETSKVSLVQNICENKKEKNSQSKIDNGGIIDNGKIVVKTEKSIDSDSEETKHESQCVIDSTNKNNIRNENMDTIQEQMNENSKTNNGVNGCGDFLINKVGNGETSDVEVLPAGMLKTSNNELIQV